MTIGDGLLYSTILILLFLAIWLITTRRGWKRFGKIVGVVATGFLSIGLAIWGWTAYSQRPVRMDVLDEIKIGMSLGDVQVKKGAPTRSTGYGEGDVNLIVYEPAYSSDSLIVLLRKSGTIESVFRVCEKGSFYAFGLTKYVGEEAVRARLGPPTESKILEDNLTKRLTYASLNVWFDIEMNQVSAFCVGLD